jgi:hypothetical protein
MGTRIAEETSMENTLPQASRTDSGKSVRKEDDKPTAMIKVWIDGVEYDADNITVTNGVITIQTPPTHSAPKKMPIVFLYETDND